MTVTQPETPSHMLASIDATVPHKVRVILNGHPVGDTWPNESEARAALTRAMFERYGMIPAPASKP